MRDDIHATIDRLEHELAELKAEIASQPPEGETTSRRGMLKVVAAGAASAAAAGVTGLVGARPAAALPNFELNVQNQQATLFTEAYYSGASGGAAFLFQSGNVYSNADASYPCALAGWGNTDAAPHGVYAFSSVSGAYALAAVSAGTGAIVYGGADGANLLLLPVGPAGPARAGGHLAGEVVVDDDGDFWACVASGSPGTWRKLAGLPPPVRSTPIAPGASTTPAAVPARSTAAPSARSRWRRPGPTRSCPPARRPSPSPPR